MIRSIKWQDVFKVRALSRWSERDGSPSLVVWDRPWSSVMAAAASVVPLLGPDYRTWIYEERGHVLGFVQTRPRRLPEQWDIVRLVVRGRAGEAEESLADPRSWQRLAYSHLVEAVCAGAGQRGVLRVFCAVRDRPEPYSLFRALGFCKLVSEHTYYRPPFPPGPAPESQHSAARLSLRPQMKQDALGIHNLYLAATPDAVKAAEGLTSRYWGGPAEPEAYSARRGLRRRLVVLEDGVVVAWALLLYGRDGPHRLRMMVHPAAPHVAPALLHYALVSLEGERPRGVLCKVREHQAGVLAALPGAQFERVDTHLLLVRQLGVPAVEPEHAPARSRRTVLADEGEWGGRAPVPGHGWVVSG
jgi:hypothetical protein